MVTIKETSTPAQSLGSVTVTDITREGIRKGFRPTTTFRDPSGKVIRRRGGGGGGRTIAAQVFESSLLSQSFSSEAALKKAESKFKAEQVLRQKAEKSRLFSIAGRRIAGQVTKKKEELGRVDKVESFLGERKQAITEKSPFFGFQAGVGIGLIKSGIGLGRFVGQAVTSPVETAKSTALGVKQILVDPASFGRQQLASAKATPGEFVGGLVGEVLIFKGTGKVISGAGKGAELGRARISPSFRGVQSRELSQFGTSERFIGGLPILGEEIVLIPGGLERRASTLTPSVRGGFGFTQAEQAQFGGKGAFVSSQADFSAFGIPLQKELFTTPPLKGVPFARESRLALGETPATIKDIFKLDFTFKKSKPSILVFPSGKGFKLGSPGTELEAILASGKTIRKTGGLGKTIIGGRKVDIIGAEVVGASADTSKLLKGVRGRGRITRAESRRLSRETGFDFTSRSLTTPRVSVPKFIGSGTLSLSRQLTKGFGGSFESLKFPTAKGISTGFIPSGGRPSRPLGGGSGFSGLSLPRTGGGSSGILLPKFGDLGAFSTAPRIRREDRKKTPKRKKTRRRVKFGIRPSFTAVTLSLKGPTFTPLIKGGFSQSPFKIRRISRKKKRK